MPQPLHIIRQRLSEVLLLLPITAGMADPRIELQIEKTKIFTALNFLIEMQLFQFETAKLSSLFNEDTAHNYIKISDSEFNEVIRTIDNLRMQAYIIFKFLTTYLPEETSTSVYVKLPSKTSDFGDLAKISIELHRALQQVLINDTVQGETTIESVENGSIIIKLKVGLLGVGLVGSLAWSAAVIAKKVNEGLAAREYIKNLEIQNINLNDVVSAQKKQLDLLIETEAKMINDEHFKKEDAENIERLKMSIETLAKLINQGAEFTPSLVTPENAANLFPDFKNLTLIESKTKKLDAGKTQE